MHTERLLASRSFAVLVRNLRLQDWDLRQENSKPSLTLSPVKRVPCLLKRQIQLSILWRPQSCKTGVVYRYSLQVELGEPSLPTLHKHSCLVWPDRTYLEVGPSTTRVVSPETETAVPHRPEPVRVCDTNGPRHYDCVHRTCRGWLR